MFKIGIGPSSSHTLGPWRAAQIFTRTLEEKNLLNDVLSVEVLLYGSLAKTGIGHGTDIAVQLGLSGDDPVTFDVNNIDAKIADIKSMQKIVLAGRHEIDFTPSDDIEFLITESLPYHPNALSFLVSLRNGDSFAETYYSIGGGFVVQEPKQDAVVTGSPQDALTLPFPINTADELLHWCRTTGMAINEVVMENENSWRPETETRAGILNIWRVISRLQYTRLFARGLKCKTTGL